MEDKKNKRDRLLNMPAEYEQNPEIAQSVIRELQAQGFPRACAKR
jgi:SRSO17 transposase